MENPKLLAAMEAHVKGGTGRETYEAFLNELILSWLIIPIQNSVTADPATGGANLPMLTQKSASGEKILSVYTDDQSFAKLKPNAPAIAELRSPDVFKLAIQVQIDHVVLNTGSPFAVAVSKKYFNELSRSKIPSL